MTGNKVVVMNGVDTLSYYDIPSNLVVGYNQVTDPAAPTLSANNVGAGGVGSITYRITCNSTVGETAASAALTVTVDTDRSYWTGTDNIVITLPTAPSGAVSYNVYMGTVANYEFLIASAVPIANTTFTDNGTFAQDPTRLYPTTNSTKGPRVSRGAVINSRAFLVGDADNPYNVWWGGDFGSELDFSPANGGGFQPVGYGTKDLPVQIKAFRDGRGNPQITVLCQGTNGRGKRYIMSANSATYGTTFISFYDVVEDNGQDGTDSPDGVILYHDAIYYPSRDGFKSTGTKPQLQNILSTDRISNSIQPDIKSLNSSAMGGAVGLGFEGRLYWAVPVNSSTNNEIWVLDLDRKGAWMKPWSMDCDWMWLYNDNDGTTHQMVLSNNKIYELSYTVLTADDGTPYQTQGASGQVYFSDDKRMWVQLLQVIIVLLRPQGTISFQVEGRTEDESITALGEPYTFRSGASTTVSGWGEPNKYIDGFGQDDWSGANGAPITASTSEEIVIEVDEEVQWASYSWNSSGAGVDYNISDVIFEYIETGIKDLA